MTRVAHALGQQRLAEDVVDLVRAGVVEILALEEDARAAAVLGEALDLGDRARTARVCAVQFGEFVAKLIVHHRLLALLVELFERGDEGLGDVASAVVAEAPEAVRRETVVARFAERGGVGHAGVPSTADAFVASAHAVMMSASPCWGSPFLTSASPMSSACAPSRA